MAKKNPGIGGSILVELTPGVFSKIPGVYSTSGPESSTGSHNVSDLDSTAEEYAPNLPDNGTFSFSFWLDDEDLVHLALLDLQKSRETVRWRKVYSTGKAEEFDGFIENFPRPSMEVNATLEASVDVKVSGPVTDVPA